MMDEGTRFWAKVDKRGPEGCWDWTASTAGGGYGSFAVGGRRKTPAHRYAYEAAHGPIPEGLHLDHLCRNRRCVNPAHLEPVTQQENIRRGEGGKYWAAKTHCPAGHPYAGANLLMSTNERGGPVRRCRTCHYARAARYDARSKDRKRELQRIRRTKARAVAA